MAYVPVVVSDEQVAELEAKHEDVFVICGGGGQWTYVVRRPTRQETIAYKQAAKKDASTASEILVRRIVVAPNGPDLDKQIDRYPFSVDAVISSEGFQGFIGLAVDEQVK